MRQSDSVSEELDTENVQCALDFENTMNELETQLYYRHLPPKEVALRVMEAACKFYDADWCGLIQVDLDLGLWKPLWWHNECQEDKTTILTNEFESSEFLDRWVKAVRRGTPMVVSDAEDVKDTYPDEYRLYERLGIKSVLAIPLEPRQIALIAVRNPQRYTHQTSMLKLLAYVLLAAYNDKRMADSLSMAFSPENIKSSHDVFISLFGELKIHTSHGVLPESDLKSPKISRLLTFMLLSNKKALSSLEIVQEIWPEELEDKDEPGKKVKQLVYRLRQAFSIISDEQLILSTPSGYQFNPDLHITTDFQRFDELCIAAAKATSAINKVRLLEKAASLYQGKLLSAANGEHWLVHYANRYHLAFMSTVNELLKQLMDFHASFNVATPYQMVVIHSSKLIYPRELYQRGIQRKRVELIARDFNEYTANEPKVSFRNGRYYVTDGQHTIEARILRNGGKDHPILCKVYTGLTMQQEALFFAEQNGHAAPLTAGIKLRAKVVGEDALSMAFLAATNRVGLDFNYDSLQLSDYRISCVGTALKLYNQMGEKIYCEALRLIVDAWEGKPDSFRAAVLKGVMYFVEVYHGEFNEERLIRALRSVHPMEIYRTGMDNPAKLPGWKKYVFPIYAAYNGKSRKDALPMKF